jgi:hypothetical protein
VFNSDEQFPAVIENVEVIMKVNFLGADIDDIGLLDRESFFKYIGNAFLMQAPSIPPNPQKLWKAFYETYKDKYEPALTLGDTNSNEFMIRINKDTAEV